MSDEIQFTCSVCGDQFEPDPAMVTDGQITPITISEDAPLPEGAFTMEELRAMTVDELMIHGIDPEDRARLLKQEPVPCTMLICTACQDRMLEEEDEE